jgi:hypothetical protein
MSSENQKIYSIHSQKGGVGKTSVAIAIAGWESILNKKKVLIIDADLTGTSITDIFKFNKENSKKLFINELLLSDPQEFVKYTDLSKNNPIKKFCHQIIDEEELSIENLFFMPSSPEFDDIKQIISLISQEDYLHFFKIRIEDIIAKCFREKFDVIIIDSSPGIFGLSQTIFYLCLEQIKYSGLKKNQDEPPRLSHLNGLKPIDTNVVIISSSDQPDYLSLFPLITNQIIEFCKGKDKISNSNKKVFSQYFSVIFNKTHEADPLKAVNIIFESLNKLMDKREEEKYKHVAKIKELIKMSDQKIADKGAISFEYCNAFHLSHIISNIINISNRKKNDNRNLLSSLKGMEKWCYSIGQYFNIFN